MKNEEYLTDITKFKDIKIPEWISNIIKVNPKYTGWSSGDDYMNGKGYSSNICIYKIDDLLKLNDFNELINFYFQYCITAPNIVTLNLQMWFIHPRKGASRGVIFKDIKEEDLPTIIEYLKEADIRNKERFSKLYNYSFNARHFTKHEENIISRIINKLKVKKKDNIFDYYKEKE